MKDPIQTKVIMYLLTSVEDILNWMHKYSNNFKKYISNMDGWVKDINKRINEFSCIDQEVVENIDNI